jgi:hypothetical protein
MVLPSEVELIFDFSSRAHYVSKYSVFHGLETIEAESQLPQLGSLGIIRVTIDGNEAPESVVHHYASPMHRRDSSNVWSPRGRTKGLAEVNRHLT